MEPDVAARAIPTSQEAFMATRRKAAKARASTRRTSSRSAMKKVVRRARPAPKPGPSLEFNHVMIYTTDLTRALAFYEGALGFVVIDTYPGTYTRLKSPGGTTIALHVAGEGRTIDPRTQGLRLYFEVAGTRRTGAKNLVSFCNELTERGVTFVQAPTLMPWGWTHAYLRDPDGHELSLYWAGSSRLRKKR
jgi:catechol 2,3-dioxygenase-like lactoylglutathione lyase family enzyme